VCALNAVHVAHIAFNAAAVLPFLPAVARALQRVSPDAKNASGRVA
jgi:hypothetical protein